MTVKPCQKCNQEFDDNGDEWRTYCKNCFVRSKTKDAFILRQVLLKVAAEQLENASPKQLVDYAKELEKEWYTWE